MTYPTTRTHQAFQVCETSLNKFKWIEIIPSTLCDPCEINKKSKTTICVGSPNIWDLKNALLNNPRIKEERRKYFERTAHENTTYQNLQTMAKTALREVFIAFYDLLEKKYLKSMVYGSTLRN